MWFERQVRPLLRISGFRLVLRSLALSLGGAALVFLIVHHEAETIWRAQIDGEVSGALADLLSDIQRNHQSVAQNVRDTMAEGGGLFFADIAPDGHDLAGNFTVSPSLLARWNGPRTLRRQEGLALPPRVLAVRGVAHEFANGETLVVAGNASPLLALNATVARSFAAVFGTILALGLLSGYLAARTASRRVDGFAWTIRDIMEGDWSRRLPTSQSGDEFDRLAAELNAMLDRLQALMENLRQVTNDIAHDLRSPLARLRGHLELSQRHFAGPDLTVVFDEALTQVDQALEIFAAILRIAELEAGARRSHFETLSLSELLGTVVDAYEPAFTAAGVNVTAVIADGLMLRGDKDLLQQMIANLLDNILLHASGANAAHLRAGRDGKRIRIEIADNGPGIAADQSRRVLQRFVRLDNARHLPGHGLGLSLVAAVIALHGGTVELIDNQPGLKVFISLDSAEEI